MKLQQAAFKILKPYRARMRSYAASHPMPPAPTRRSWPTENFIWRRYLSSMITSMTRSTNDLWEGLAADPTWEKIRGGGPEACPSEAFLRRFLAAHRIRFPAQKALRIRRSLDRDFAGLAKEMRSTFATVHDARRDKTIRRREEVRLAVLLQEELAGCGVAPKIARLALMGAQEITQVIPLDSRWQNALREHGYDLTPAQLANEPRYREFEDAICEASYVLGVRPTDADVVPFGWTFEDEES